MKVIKITDDAYKSVVALSKEVEKPISEVASMLIINKDKKIRLTEKVIKELEVEGEKVTG